MPVRAVRDPTLPGDAEGYVVTGDVDKLKLVETLCERSSMWGSASAFEPLFSALDNIVSVILDRN